MQSHCRTQCQRMLLGSLVTTARLPATKDHIAVASYVWHALRYLLCSASAGCWQPARFPALLDVSLAQCALWLERVCPALWVSKHCRAELPAAPLPMLTP